MDISSRPAKLSSTPAFVHATDHSGQLLWRHGGDRSQRQSRQTPLQYLFHRFLPCPDHMVPKMLVARSIRPMIFPGARHVGAIGFRTQQNHEEADREAMLATLHDTV